MSVDFSGITLPFTPADLLSAAVDLLGVVGPFVLLGLAFIFAPYFFTLIRAAARKGNSRGA